MESNIITIAEENEILDVFKRLGLTTQKDRDKFLQDSYQSSPEKGRYHHNYIMISDSSLPLTTSDK